VLGIGRSLTPSKIEATWAKLHPQERKSEPTKPISQQTRTADITPISQPVIKHYNIATDEYHSYHVEIPEAADNIIRQNCSLEEAHPLAKLGRNTAHGSFALCRIFGCCYKYVDIKWWWL
jgi:hypothetical protein